MEVCLDTETATIAGIHYEAAGAGTAVVLLHGATMDHRMWGSQIPALAASHRLIIPDLPGHGRSRPVAHFSLQRCGQAVMDILDAEGLASVHLIGQSMGGYIAQIIAFEHPQRVKSVVAVDSSPLDASYYSRGDRMMLALTPTLLRLYPSASLKRSIAQGVSVTPEGRDLAAMILASMSKTEMAVILKAVYRGLLDYAEHRVRLTCPTLLLWGEQDTSGKVVAYCMRWAEEESLPVQVIENAGHNSNVDNPGDFNAAVLKFIDEVDAG